MSTKIRAILLMAVVGLFASLMVAPAAAMTNAVGQFTGTAAVGKWFSSPCDKNANASVEGRGLYFPGVPGSGQREENGVWRFSGAGPTVAQTQDGLADSFSIAACGQLAPVVDLTPDSRFTVGNLGIGGASCGNSKGHHGQGYALFGNGERVKLFDVGWKTSAGGVLPVTGRYQEYVNDSGDPNSVGNKKQKFGLVVAEVVAVGGAGCTGQPGSATNNGNGAQTFIVQGAAELVNTGAEITEDPKEELLPAKKCKEVGPEDRTDPSGLKTHENKPGTHACTEADGGDKNG